MVNEVTLDPENWDELRALGHRMLDDMMNYLETIASKPFSLPPMEAVQNICAPLTREGEGEKKVYEVFKQYNLPYTSMNNRPRFWGVVAGTGSPYGMLAEMLRAGTNNGLETLEAAGYVHKQVIEWIKKMLDYPKEEGGVAVSGGSEANFTGLAVARNEPGPRSMLRRALKEYLSRLMDTFRAHYHNPSSLNT
jgi:aromatic-L-amino-acid decarboxylase